MPNLTPARKLPLAIKIMYEVYGLSGGNGSQGPVRNDAGIKGADLPFMIFNGAQVFAPDLRLSNDLIGPYYDPHQGWCMIETIDGTLFVTSPSGENWMEYRSHLRLPGSSAPQPPGNDPDFYIQIGKAFEILVKAFSKINRG